MAGTSTIKPAPSLDLFASPDHIDPKLLLFLEQASVLLCKWFAKASESGPLPEMTPLPGVFPADEGLSVPDLLKDIQLIMDGSYQPSHPGALAHLDPPPLTASIAADLICAGINNNMLADELSPSLSRLERQLCKWFADRIGLPSEAGGVAASGGSLSNLMALVVARQQANLKDQTRGVVIASADAHVCLTKAIRVMGLSADSLQKVDTDLKGQISLDLLENQLKLIKSKGRKCFAIVATAGTTLRGAIDPLLKLSELCKREGIWLHVDASIGGVFALSKSTQFLLDGISKANSITLNPQKVLGITKTSSILLVANSKDLASSFSTGLPYIEPSSEEPHCGEMGLQGTRSAEVLKLWLGLRQLGEKGIQEILDKALERRFYFENKLDNTLLEILGGPLHLLAFTPKYFDSSKAAKWSTDTRKLLLEQNFMLSRPRHQDRYYLKVVMGNPHTQTTHLDQLAEYINQTLKETS